MNELQQLLGYVGSGLIFMLMLAVLVFVHELGHFWAARALGMKVDAFAVMFGGIRKTDLRSSLDKPILDSRIVGALYGLAVFAALLGTSLHSAALSQVALFSLATVFPIWICLRIGRLYHLSLLASLKPLLFAYGALVAVGLFGTKGAIFNSTNSLLQMLFIGGIIGTLFVYYTPVIGKPESAPMGDGKVGDLDVQFRPIASRKDKHGTEFSLLLLPLGGFAAIKGMHPKEDGSETQIENGFYSKSPFARWLVLFAGPLFSILLGVILYATSLSIYGDEKPVNKPIIGELNDKGAAKAAGIQVGDKVVSVNGKTMTSFYDIILMTRQSGGKTLSFIIDRNGMEKKIELKPTKDTEETRVFNSDLELTEETAIQYKLGMGPKTVMVPVSFGQAISMSASLPVEGAVGFVKTFSQPAKAKDNVAGPASIASATHQAAKEGFFRILNLAAVLSLSLGFMNLLPVPPLDGGQMVVAFIEMFRKGKRLSIDTQMKINTVGFMLVAMLMFFVFSQDAAKLLVK
ncbi:MAG: site-2 protease family protein [Armatimonadetes bacterium]|nr:site-2 protease family protein [Armatimonadota bacterium]